MNEHEYYVGFTFTDNLWDDLQERGSIIGLDLDGRWVVAWDGNWNQCTYETDETIADMIRGSVP